MLKFVLLLLSEYYYGIAVGRLDGICRKMERHHVSVRTGKVLQTDGGTVLFGEDAVHILDESEKGESLAITDEPESARWLIGEGWYVVILYHEKNRGKNFPPVRYGVEDLFLLEYRSYEEAFKRLAGLPWDILETDRLKVREGILEDVDEYYRIYKEPSITLYMENLFEEREKELAYMKAYIDQIYGFYGYGLWTVLLKETGQVIGRAGISIRQGYETPELGFVIDVPHQRQGYGFEVCTAILGYAKEELGFERMQAFVDRRNLVSQGLLRKLGFRFERNVHEEGHDYELFIKDM